MSPQSRGECEEMSAFLLPCDKPHGSVSDRSLISNRDIDVTGGGDICVLCPFATRF